MSGVFKEGKEVLSSLVSLNKDISIDPREKKDFNSFKILGSKKEYSGEDRNFNSR